MIILLLWPKWNKKTCGNLNPTQLEELDDVDGHRRHEDDGQVDQQHPVLLLLVPDSPVSGDGRVPLVCDGRHQPRDAHHRDASARVDEVGVDGCVDAELGKYKSRQTAARNESS